MALKAIKPELLTDAKPKFLISGKSGAGKTFFTLDFPSVYYIDTEGGATRSQYRQKMLANKAAYFGKEQGSQDFKTVIDEIKSLATTKHEYKTLVIDSFSFLYNLAASVAEEKIGNDFGRDKKEANKPTRQLMRWIENLDMNVILICHHKDKWERAGKEVICSGSTFDGFDKMEYALDLWVEVQKNGKDRSFIVKKSRIDQFPEGERFPLEYKVFALLYGKNSIEKESKPIVMATEDQIIRIKGLIEVVKVEDDVIKKWFDKANVSEWEEMNQEQIEKCICFLESKLKQIQKIQGDK